MKLIKKEFIYDELIPAPSCHASTLLKLSNGDVVAAWFAGRKEGATDVMIWCSRMVNGVWSKPLMVTTKGGIPHWNPVLFQMGENTLYLFYKIGHTIPDWKTMYMISTDGGVSWSEEKELIPGDDTGGRGPVKNKPIRISNGNVLAPASTERGIWKCFVDVMDHDNNWTKKEILSEDKVNLIQPTLWESAPGKIHALMRSKDCKIYRSDSDDGGQSWSMAYPTDMPNNNSGIDCVLTRDGVLVLVCNPVAGERGPRTPLTVFTSTDNGSTFQKEIDIEVGDGQFSYPAVVSYNNRIYITYTWKRKKIGYCELEL